MNNSPDILGYFKNGGTRRIATLLFLAWAIGGSTLTGTSSCTTPWIQDPANLEWRQATVAETQNLITNTGKEIANVTTQAVGAAYTPLILALTQLAALMFAWTVRPPTPPTQPTVPKETQT